MALTNSKITLPVSEFDLDINSASVTIPSTDLSSGGSYSIDMSSWNNSMAYYNVTTPTNYTISTGGTYSTTGWSSDLNGASLEVTGDANFKGDVKVKGKSLTEFMETLEKRLAILQPDPAKLEKFEALRKAYNHYKLLEALCQEEENTDGDRS